MSAHAKKFVLDISVCRHIAKLGQQDIERILLPAGVTVDGVSIDQLRDTVTGLAEGGDVVIPGSFCVGRNTDAPMPNGEVCRIFASHDAGADFIGDVLEKLDPKGVYEGDYYLDAMEEEGAAAFQFYRRAKSPNVSGMEPAATASPAVDYVDMNGKESALRFVDRQLNPFAPEHIEVIVGGKVAATIPIKEGDAERVMSAITEFQPLVRRVVGKPKAASGPTL